METDHETFSLWNLLGKFLQRHVVDIDHNCLDWLFHRRGKEDQIVCVGGAKTEVEPARTNAIDT